MKHCNRAHVWGILDKYKDKTTAGGKPYLEVLVDCRHNIHGNVRVLGFIWGKANVADFKANFEKGDDVRFSGGIQQYNGRHGATRTTFNFYILKPGPVEEYKATFILVGEVVSLEDETLEILVKQEAAENYEAKEDAFKIHLPREILLEAEQTPEQGQTVSAKGYIHHPEDEFGEPAGPQQPVIKELKSL